MEISQRRDVIFFAETLLFAKLNEGIRIGSFYKKRVTPSV